MNRKLLLLVVALSSAGAAHAQTALSQLTFEGEIVSGACNPAQPSLGAQGGMGRCGNAAVGAIYAEHTSTPVRATGIAMLDYFAERPDGGQKYVVTRQYL